MIANDTEYARAQNELDNLERNAGANIFNPNYQARILTLRMEIQQYLIDKAARLREEEARKRLEEAAKAEPEEKKAENLTKKQRIDALKIEIAALEVRRTSPQTSLGEAIQISTDISLKRVELQELEDEVFINDVYNIDPAFYRAGDQVSVKIGGLYMVNPKEEFSVGEGEMPFIKLGGRQNARYHIFIKPSRKFPEIVAKPDFQLTLEFARDPDAERNGMAFGRYGTMYVHTGNTNSLFYSPHWIVDPEIELGQKKYDRSAWRFIADDRSIVVYPKYGIPYRLQNRDGEYMYVRGGEYVGGTRSYADASVVVLERVGSTQTPIVPDKDFVARAGDKAGKTCGNLPADASLAQMASCATTAVGDQTVEDIENSLPDPRDLIPWWVYAIGGVAGVALVRSFVR